MIPRERLMTIAPSRLTWLPGDPLDGRQRLLAYREAQPVDLPRVKEALRGLLPARVIDRAVKRVEGVVRVAVLNNRVVCATSVSFHRPDVNGVEAVWTDERYRESEALAALLTLAGLEVPEAPTTLWVPEHDSWTQAAVARLGDWNGRPETPGDSSAGIVFTRGPLADPGPRGRDPARRDPPARPGARRGGE